MSVTKEDLNDLVNLAPLLSSDLSSALSNLINTHLDQKARLERLIQEKIKLEVEFQKRNKLEQPIFRIHALRKTLNSLFDEGYLGEDTSADNTEQQRTASLPEPSIT
jgi:hypothetical protein